MFTRSDYYSQSQICKLFKMSTKRFKELLKLSDIVAIEKKITLHTQDGTPYEVTAIYIHKDEVAKLIEHYINT